MTETSSRRTDTRSRIVEMAAQMLHEHGPAAVTTRAVAEAAGVQPPAIYRLFGDKDGLLEAVAEYVMATHVTAKAAIVAAASSTDVDPLEDLRNGWSAQIEFGLANPALFHLLSDPARAAQSAAVRAGREVLRARVHRLAETGRLRVSEGRAAELIHAAGLGAVGALLAAPPADRDHGLADALFESVLRQILTATTSLTGDASVAVTLRAVAPQLDVLSEAERRLLVEWLDRVIAAG